MKFTVLAFRVYRRELEDDMHDRTELGRLLDDTIKHRADICEGIYVFDTRKGWRDMNRLRQFLMNAKKEFVEVPFEETLAGFFSPAVCEKLRALGESSGSEISLLNLNTA